MSQRQSPGQLLREAREAQKIEPKVAADYLNISIGKLQAIEHDQFEKLHSETFIRGYLRAYGKYMQLGEAEIIQVFEDYVRDTRAEASDHEQEATDSAESTSLPSWLPLAAIAAAGLIWLLVNLMLTTDDADTSQDGHVSAGVVLESEANSSSQAVALTVDSFEGTEETSLTTALADSTDELTESSEPELASSVAGVSEDQDLQVEPEQAKQPSDQSLAQAPTSAPGDNLQGTEDRLVFQFTEDCWLEVTDAAGKRLFSKLAQAGSEVSLQGQAPFEIMLGNVRATSLQVNGSEFTLQPQGARKTLRFSVDS